jgi:hypothetical protein
MIVSFVRERFSPRPMAANASHTVRGIYLGGFLAKTAGTITVVAKDPSGLSDVTYVDAIPVTAGVYTPIPVVFPSNEGFTVTLAGGASGTLMV